MAPYAFFPDQRWLTVFFHDQSLMAPVHTGYTASAASHAMGFVKNRITYGIPVQILSTYDPGQRFSYKSAYPPKTGAAQIFFQAGFQILNDPVAVFHHRSGDL